MTPEQRQPQSGGAADRPRFLSRWASRLALRRGARRRTSHGGVATTTASASRDRNTDPPHTTRTIPIGGLAYVDWTFDRSIHSIEAEVRIFSEAPRDSNLYMQIYEADIGRTHQYFGIQSTGRLIFSAFDSTDQRDVRFRPPAYGKAANDEGNYLTVRMDVGRLRPGVYKIQLVRAEEERGGDWFEYFVEFPDATKYHVGGIRFPRQATNTPLTIARSGGSWLEFWDNSSGGPMVAKVPTWSVAVAVTVNDGVAPERVTGKYSARQDGLSPPQSNIRMQADSSVRIDVGEAVIRTNIGSSNGVINLPGAAG